MSDRVLLNSGLMRTADASVEFKNFSYAGKYKKEYDTYLQQAKEIAFEENFNYYDKTEIKEKLTKKLRTELEKRDFIDNKKFDLIEGEVNNALSTLNLNN